MIRHLLPAAAVIFSGLHASALEPGAPFADHAVLQRQQPVPVWGWSKPGTEVTVEFAGQRNPPPPHKTASGCSPSIRSKPAPIRAT